MILFFCLLSSLGESGLAQLRVGISGTIPIGKLEKMDDELLVADPGPKLDLLKRLGVDANVAEAVTQPSFVHDIEIHPIHTRSGKYYGLLSLPCGLQGQAFLYLLEAKEADSWHTVDSVALDCFHQTPTYRLLTLTPGEECILVQHASAGHGTGEMEDKATVYAIRGGRMREALSTVDFLSRVEIGSDAPPIEQSGSFLQISCRTIEETRITSQNGVPPELAMAGTGRSLPADRVSCSPWVSRGTGD
jgi:hypothetical protein